MEKVYFEKINGSRVFTFFSEPKKPSKKIVIMSHGFRSSSIGPARQFVDFSRLLLKNGFSILRFDQPKSGNSDGEYLKSSFKEWVTTISYFAKKFLNKRYKVALLGQSMGATASVIASARRELKDKIFCLLLWVPDPKSAFNKKANQIFEEEGQRYLGKFWQEAKEANFFKCLDAFKCGIHLVYGEKDRYINKGVRNKVIEKVKKKGQSVMVLPGQDHSPWKFKVAQIVYRSQLKKLLESLK